MHGTGINWLGLLGTFLEGMTFISGVLLVTLIVTVAVAVYKGMSSKEKKGTSELDSLMQELRNDGYAVAVFTPKDLDTVDPKQVQIAMQSAGASCIEYWSK